MPSIDKNSRIVVVGAGPAGLSSAYYLKKRGYRNVTVLERLGRVGGLCRTITEDGYSFDLGANYVTPAYSRVLAIAREHRAKLYAERDGAVLNEGVGNSSTFEHTSIWNAVRGDNTFAYLRDCLRFARLRWKLRDVLKTPGFKDIEERPDLCVPFHEWLESHNLTRLYRLFEVPITVMGYGYVRCPDGHDIDERERCEISTPYALKYMTLKTFVPMVFKFSPLMRLIPWPKRFVLGYQRLWELVSYRLNVRLNTDILHIERDDDGVHVTLRQREQILNSVRPSNPTTHHYDYLVLACPLSLDVLSRTTSEGDPMLDLSSEESGLFKKVITYSYALSSCSVKGWQKSLPRILCTLPLTKEGSPWAITRQMENSEMTQFYSRIPGGVSDHVEKTKHAGEEAEVTHDETEFQYVQGRRVQELPHQVADFIEQMGWEVDDEEWKTFDCWPYFQHVSIDDIRERFYTKLEALQGVNRTYYVGALMNFELVENVMEYSEALVDRMTWR